MEYVLTKANACPIGSIQRAKNATLEGGDYVAFSTIKAAIGVGLRSSYSACMYLMQQDLLGTKKLIVVKDVFDTN